MSEFARASRRARSWLALLVCVAAVAFFVLPILYNGTLFGTPVHEEVFAARHQTPTPAPIISTPEPTEIVIMAQSTPDTMIDIEYPTLKFEDDDEAVSALQERLMELGYFDYDIVTTYYGTVTQSSIELFQRAHGLEQTGIADSETQRLLFSVNALLYHMKPGDRGSDIRSVQRRLSELGYYEEKDNGYFGIATQRALEKFFERNKIKETTIIDQDTAHLLFSPNARPLVDPTPTPTKKPTPTPTKKPTPTPTKTPTPSASIPIIEPEQTSTPTPAQTQKTTEPPASYGSGVNAMIAAAKAQLGKPYVLGDDGPDSYDCSGLVYYSLRAAGVNVGRYSAANYALVSNWQAIDSLDKCVAGDLLFFKSDRSSNISHTGIYLGGGQFIHAATSSERVLISSLTGYYYNNFVIARRVF